MGIFLSSHKTNFSFNSTYFEFSNEESLWCSLLRIQNELNLQTLSHFRMKLSSWADAKIKNHNIFYFSKSFLYLYIFFHFCMIVSFESDSTSAKVVFANLIFQRNCSVSEAFIRFITIEQSYNVTWPYSFRAKSWDVLGIKYLSQTNVSYR